MKTNMLTTRWLTPIIALLILAITTACNEQSIVETGGLSPDKETIGSTGGVLRIVESLDSIATIKLGNETIERRLYFELTKSAANATNITVTVEPALIEAYNKTHKTNFEVFPTENVTIDNDGKLSIPAGEKQSPQTKITFNKGELQHGTKMVAVTVKETTGNPSQIIKSRNIYFRVMIPEKAEPTTFFPHNKDFKISLFVNTEDVNPLISYIFYFSLNDMWTSDLISESNWIDIVNLMPAGVKYDTQQKRFLFSMGPDLAHVLRNAEKYIEPLKNEEIKVCITVKNMSNGIGFYNMTDAQIADLTQQLKLTADTYRLDGINLWDEGTGYGKEGMPAPNPESYPKFIKSLREAMPDKIITLTDISQPTATMYDKDKCGGIEVGRLIDYAWSGHRNHSVNPWDINSSRKPIAGITKQQYGGLMIDYTDKRSDPPLDSNQEYKRISDETAKLKKDGVAHVFAFYEIVPVLQRNTIEINHSALISGLYPEPPDEWWDNPEPPYAGGQVHNYSGTKQPNELTNNNYAKSW